MLQTFHQRSLQLFGITSMAFGSLNSSKAPTKRETCNVVFNRWSTARVDLQVCLPHAEERPYLNILRMQGDYSRVVDDKESIKGATLFTPTQKEIRIANWINSKYSGLVLTT